MIGSKFFTLIGSEFSFVSIFLRFAAQNCTVMGHSAYNKFYLLKMLEGAKLSAVVLLDNILVTSFDKRRPLLYRSMFCHCVDTLTQLLWNCSLTHERTNTRSKPKIHNVYSFFLNQSTCLDYKQIPAEGSNEHQYKLSLTELFCIRKGKLHLPARVHNMLIPA